MPPYAALQQLIDRYGAQEIEELSDRTGTSEIDAAVVAAALADAHRQIDPGIFAGSG